MKTTIILKYNIHIIIVFLSFLTASMPAVGTNYYFYVQLANKNNSSYSLSKPSEFLSARAITRRENLSLSIDSTDLPINSGYLQQIENLGVPVHNRSKWMNGVTVLVSDSAIMSQVRTLSFVKFVQYTGKLEGAPLVPAMKAKNQTDIDYGTATTQIDQMNGKYLHNLGYRGKNILIGVLDAGFNNVNVNSAFDSLRLQGRLLGTKDIINPSSNIYAEDAHGAMVLSTMTGNLPGQFLGTAPDASFWLIRTEYAPTEYLVETDFWCSGIEFADSVGVDVVNSSLGYTTFDDPTMNFTYADMNGKVSRASRAAELAAKKGIIVCNSAGNDGAKVWKYIGSPADAEGIISVGAITSAGIPSYFTSFGPSSDNRVKPEICSMGTAAAVVSTSGVTSYGNGTSFASPIMAGMMACFLQASKTTYPHCDIHTLLTAVFESGSLFKSPTELMGYGIPNFETALAKLPFLNGLKIAETKDVVIGFNNDDKTIHIRLFDDWGVQNNLIRIYSISGSLQISQLINEPETVLNVTKLLPGIYVVNISGNKKTSTHKVIIR